MPTKYGTVCIRRRHAENVFHAVRYASEVGRPLNVLVSINFTELGVPENEATSLFQDLSARVVRWWRYERSKGRPLGDFSAAHAHANPHERRHVHWLLHVAPTERFRFEAQLLKLLGKITGQDRFGDGLDVRSVTNVGTLAKYMLRGVEPAYADYFNMWASNEGLVTGRRTGTSRSIGRAARKDAKWRRKRRRS